MCMYESSKLGTRTCEHMFLLKNFFYPPGHNIVYFSVKLRYDVYAYVTFLENDMNLIFSKLKRH